MKNIVGYAYLENKIKEISEEYVLGYRISEADSTNNNRKLALDPKSGDYFIIFVDKKDLIETFIKVIENEFVELGIEIDRLKDKRLKLNEELRQLSIQQN